MKLLKLSLCIVLLYLCQTLESHGVRKKRNHEITQILTDHLTPVIQRGQTKNKARVSQGQNTATNVLPQNIYNLKQKPARQNIPRPLNAPLDDITKKVFIPYQKPVQSKAKVPSNILVPEKETTAEKQNKVAVVAYDNKNNKPATDNFRLYKKEDYFEDGDVDLNDESLLTSNLKTAVEGESRRRYSVTQNNETDHKQFKEKTQSANVKIKQEKNSPDNFKKYSKQDNKTETNILKDKAKAVHTNINFEKAMTTELNNDNNTMSRKCNNNNTQINYTPVDYNNKLGQKMKIQKEEHLKKSPEKEALQGNDEASNINFIVNIDSDVVKSFQYDPNDRITIKDRNYEEVIEKHGIPAEIDYRDAKSFSIPENTYNINYFNENLYNAEANTNAYSPDTTYIKQPYEYPFANEMNIEELNGYKQNDIYSCDSNRKAVPTDKIWRKWKNTEIRINGREPDKPVDFKVESFNQNDNIGEIRNKVYDRLLDNGYWYGYGNNNMQMMYPYYLYPYNYY